MFKGLRKIDFSCSIVGLSYAGERRYKSPLGGIVSIILSLCIIAILIYDLRNFFGRKNQNFNLEIIKNWNPPALDLSTNFTFAMTMNYAGVKGFKERILKVSAREVTRRHLTKTYQNVSIIPCQKNFFIDNEDIYETLQLEKGICFNLTGFHLQGSSVNEIFKYIEIKFSLCNETVEDCESNIENIFRVDQPMAYIYFLDAAFQTSNSTSKVRRYINFIDFNVTYSNSKVTNIYFSKNVLNVDNGYFFGSNAVQYFNYMIDFYRELSSMRTDNQEVILTVNLLCSNKSEIYSISFMKISELIANVSAMINICILIFSNIAEYINSFCFDNDLVNALYSLKNNSEKMNNLRTQLTKSMMTFDCKNKSKFINLKKSVVKVNQKRKDPIDFHPFQVVNSSTDDLTNDNGTQKELPQIKRNDSNSRIGTIPSLSANHGKVFLDRKFSYGEIFIISFGSFIHPIRLCGKLMKIKNKYLFIKEKISLGQDILNWYQKMQEVDLIKYLLLNKKQLSLYRIIPKPFLFLSGNNQEYDGSFSYFYNRKDSHYLKTNNEICEVFANGDFEKKILYETFSNSNRSIVDKKLLKIFEDRLLQN